MTFADVRQQIADLIRNDAEWTTYAYPPQVPLPMSVVLVPDDPYIVSTNGKSSLLATIRMRVCIYLPSLDNQGNLEQLERIATIVRRSIQDATQNIGDLSGPVVEMYENGYLLTAHMPFETLAEWSTT